MGKASRKKEKNIRKKEEKEIKKKGKGIRGELDALLEKGKYAEALDAVVEILQADGGDADVYYKAAYCYYMEEDYDRSLRWVNEALTKDPNNIRSKMLLARICWFKHRVKDGLAILQLLMDKAKGALTEEDLEFVQDFLADAKEDADISLEDYPALLSYGGTPEAKQVPVTGQKPAIEKPTGGHTSAAQTALESLKAKLRGTAPKGDEGAPSTSPVSTPVEDPPAPKGASEQGASASSAQTALESLKAKLRGTALKGDEGAPSISPVSTPVEDPPAPKGASEQGAPASSALVALERLKAKLHNRAYENSTKQLETKQQGGAVTESAHVGEDTAKHQAPAERKAEEKTPEQIGDEILSKPVSVAEKIRLLNVFAAGFYAKDDCASAKHLLTTALRIDDQDGTSIRNMAFTLKAMGDAEKAMEFAVRLPVADFAVIAALKG